jgi:hypothetical protein
MWRSYGFWPAPGASPSLSERLAGLLNQEESARIIGRAYLRVAPGEASARVLTARLAERMPEGLQSLKTADDNRLRELLRGDIAGDFRDLRIVEVHGWVFARTEARLCALTALRERSTSA